MKNYYYLAAGLLSLLPALAHGQTDQGKTALPVMTESKQAWQRPLPIQYYNAWGVRVTDPKNSEYHSQTTMHDSISGTERVYLANGELFLVLPYSDVAKRVQEGVVTTYYPNGNVKSAVEFHAGKRHGAYKLYYPNGKLQQQAVFAHDVFQSGNQYTRGGKVLAFHDGPLNPGYTTPSPVGAPTYAAPVGSRVNSPGSSYMSQTSQPLMRSEAIQPINRNAPGNW